MQGVIFAKVLQMSLTGCYSIGIVLLVRLLLKRCGRAYAYYLWVLLFVGLCLPVSLPGHYSLIPRQVAEFSLMDLVTQEEPAVALQGQIPQDPPVTLRRLTPAGVLSGQSGSAAGGPVSAEVSDVQGAARVSEGQQREAGVPESGISGRDRTAYLARAEQIWLLGILLLLLYHLSAMWRMARRCSGYGQPGWREGGWIVEAESVPSPFLWGFLRPVIYLPSGLEDGERSYILAHETVHRNRGDHLVRILILAAAVLHWFNLLVWIACVLCIRDMEISCDEAVLQSSGAGIRKSYAESLLKYAAKQNRFLVGPPGFGEPSVKSRIKHVLHFRKKSVWVSLAAGLCVAVVAAGFLHHPSGDEALPGAKVREAEPLPSGEEPEEAESEGLVSNNGGEIVCVAGEYYYMDGVPLYSDAEALYASSLDEEGTWHVCRYETDGSGFRQLFDGRIVDSMEYGQILYCMFPDGNSGKERLGWYDTRTEETGTFSGEAVSWLGAYEGYLYVSRKEADGIHVDRIRQSDLTEEPDLINEGIPAEEILEFYAGEGGKRLIFAVRNAKENADSREVLCCSCDTESGEFISKELTGLPDFAMMDGSVYFQRYRSREDLTLELFRVDQELNNEEQIGEGLTLLRTEEETNTLLAEKVAGTEESGYVSSLVRIWPDQKKEQTLLDMEQMLPAPGRETALGNVWLDWDFQPGDRVAYSELNRLDGRTYVTVGHLRGQTGQPLEEVHLTVRDEGGIGVWFPDELTPGWEDDSWYTEPVVGLPAGMEADGWDLENVIDMRGHDQELPTEPGASERRRTCLLGETEHWTLYGKGDGRSMLLARNGRYTEINHPYGSGDPVCPELMEADLDHDGITELAIRLNLKNGTGGGMDSMLVADFQNNGAWVYRIPEEDWFPLKNEGDPEAETDP